MNKQRYKIKDIAEIFGKKAIRASTQDEILYLTFDSRKIENPSQSLFFALRAERDGHCYVKDAYQQGVRNFVVEEGRDNYLEYSNANFFEVVSVLDKLQELATYHRAQFQYPVWAIGGSNGKTIVKDWLNQLLSPDYSIVRSPKSFNSQIGVALSLWQMSDDHNIALIEAGISKPSEMQALRKMIRPTIGVLTNIKEAHGENFENQHHKIREKLELFKDVKLLVYSPKYISKEYSKSFTCDSFTWGYEPECDLYVKDVQKISSGNHLIRAIYKGASLQIIIPFHDEASIENAIICWACLLVTGIEQVVIESRMANLVPVKMRLELKTGIYNTSIIDDSYSCDIASLTIALDFLQQQNQHQKRSLILSDIPELGKETESTYKRVAALINHKGIERFIGIGKEISSFYALFNDKAMFYPSTQDFITHLNEVNFHDETILIKGARKFHFEDISKALSLKIHETSLEINLNALEHNLKLYKSQLDDKTKMMVMVKAFSYGSGSYEIANLLQFNHVDYLAVAYADEGITLRKAGIKLPIMVMSPDLLSLETLVGYSLEPEIFSFSHLNAFIALLEKMDIQEYAIHLKLDTGMHRLGFNPEDLKEITHLITESKRIRIASVFSHLAAADDVIHDDFTRAQIHTLTFFSDALSKALGYRFLTHIANTSAITRFPEAHLDMVRLGIGLYGIKNLSSQNAKLEAVATLKTVVSQVKRIAVEDSVGYGREGSLATNGEIATVKIGYADGYSRRFGNGVGKMLINGQLVPTVGNICMDMCMLEVSGLDVREGDEVIVFGEELRVEELAKAVDTIPYELLTGISQRVKRVYFYE